MRASCFSNNTSRCREGNTHLSQWRFLGLDFTKAKVGGMWKCPLKCWYLQRKHKPVFQRKNMLPWSLTFEQFAFSQDFKHLLEFRMLHFHLKYRGSIFKEVCDILPLPSTGSIKPTNSNRHFSRMTFKRTTGHDPKTENIFSVKNKVPVSI